MPIVYLWSHNKAGLLAVWREGDTVGLRLEIDGHEQDNLLIAADTLEQLASKDVVETSGLPLLRQREHPAWAWGDSTYVLFRGGRFVIVATDELISAAQIRTIPVF